MVFIYRYLSFMFGIIKPLFPNILLYASKFLLHHLFIKKCYMHLKIILSNNEFLPVKYIYIACYMISLLN